MSVRDWFRRRTDQRNLTIDWDKGAPPPTSPVTVSVHQALCLSPVFAAGRLLATSVSMLPLQTYRRTGDRRERLSDPSLFREPSAQGGLHDWLFRAMTSLIYRGNAIGLITARDAYEFPTMIEWLKPDEVAVDDSQPYGPGSFIDPIWYWRGRVVPAADLVHIPWFTLPGHVWGLSPIGAYASTVATGLSAKEFSRVWFDSGGVPPGTFKNTTQTVDQDAANIVKRRLVHSIRSHEPIVYGADWDYTPISISPNEAKFIETLKLGATEIASIYGIPPEMIGGESGASMTYANVENQSINFVQFTLMPWLKRLEDALSALLSRPQYVKFNVDALVRSDAQTRYANYKVAREIGLMSVDEIRALEDMAPLPNGLGTDPSPLIGLLPKENITALAPKDLAQGQGQAPASSGAAQSAAQQTARQLELVTGEDEDRRSSDLQYGKGSALWKYWTKGEGLAKWSGAVHKWTTLHRLLLDEGVPVNEVDGLTTNIIEAVMPGYMKQAHQKKSS